MLHLDHAYKKINSTFIDSAEDLDIAMLIITCYNIVPIFYDIRKFVELS